MNAREGARAVLAERDIEAKLAGAEALWNAWLVDMPDIGADTGPILEIPGLPDKPALASPKTMPRRELSGPENHAALIHSLAHIEFNAINLALDAAQRFAGFPRDYYGDWLRVAAEEAYHFRLLRDHLRALGRDYGDFPAHAGLWEMARKTVRDPLARMALVPRLLEARGLDVTPDIQRKLRGYGDRAGADILDIILRDEISHVAAGDRWFRHLCAERGLEPEAAFRGLLNQPGIPFPRRPFNIPARLAAGFSEGELDALARTGPDRDQAGSTEPMTARRSS